MTRMGKAALEKMATTDSSSRRCTRSAPLGPARRTCRGRATTPNTSPTSRRPGDLELRLRLRGQRAAGQKCYSLRIASVMARDEGWLAEHMLILKLISRRTRPTTSPRRSRRPAARPTSPCCSPPSPAGAPRPSVTTSPGCGSARTVALRGQPGVRVLRRRAGYQLELQPERDEDHRRRQHGLHQRRADRRGGVWWEGLEGEPQHLIDWKGRDWTPDSDEPAAHPNSRYCTPMSQCPTLAPEWDDPQGVPISAILFGGRRKTTVPLVTQARDWQHGVFIGATWAARPPPPRARSAPSAATRWPCCRSSATTPATIASTGSISGRTPTSRSCRRSSSSTGSAAATTAASCGRASVRTAALKWIVERVGQGQRGVDPDRYGARCRRSRPVRSGCRGRRCRRRGAVNASEWRDELPQIEEWFEFIGEKLPTGVRTSSRPSAAPGRSRLASGRRGPHRDRRQRARVRVRSALTSISAQPPKPPDPHFTGLISARGRWRRCRRWTECFPGGVAGAAGATAAAAALSACGSSTHTESTTTVTVPAGVPITTERSRPDITDPDTALAKLKKGNGRFVTAQMLHPDQGPADAAGGCRRPEAVRGGAEAARTPAAPEVIFDQGLGDLFVIRVAGNVVDPAGLGSIEYAVGHPAPRWSWSWDTRTAGRCRRLWKPLQPPFEQPHRSCCITDHGDHPGRCGSRTATG